MQYITTNEELVKALDEAFEHYLNKGKTKYSTYEKIKKVEAAKDSVKSYFNKHFQIKE